MKKLLLLFTLGLMLPTPMLKAQNPDAIYIGTWTLMSDLGKAVTPSPSDPMLAYNATTGCYEGEVLNWPRLAVNPYNAKIPYSVNGDVITYYGVAGSTQQLNFNTNASQSFTFSANTSPSSFKGFGISSANSTSITDVKVSLNLSSNTITFTKFESSESAVLPTLVSVDPVVGSEITPDADGGTTVVLTFSGKVDSMDVVSEDYGVNASANSDGTVWTLTIPANVIASSTTENQGKLVLKIQKVYADGLPVSFDNGSPVLELAYPIAGMTSTVTFKFEGESAALETLNMYKSPEYLEGDQLDFTGTSITISFKTSATYLFTAGTGYNVTISSSVNSDNGVNWASGTGSVKKKNETTGEATGAIAATGPTLSLYPGSNGATFTITVSKPTGVSTLETESSLEIYNLQGMKIDSNKLGKGLYIINGKKVLVK